MGGSDDQRVVRMASGRMTGHRTTPTGSLLSSDGCNLHGEAFTYGCPGCSDYDDALIGEAIKWRIRKIDYLPTRTARLLGYDKDTLDLNLGPWRWMKPRLGPLSGRLGDGLVRLLNRVAT